MSLRTRYSREVAVNKDSNQTGSPHSGRNLSENTKAKLLCVLNILWLKWHSRLTSLCRFDNVLLRFLSAGKPPTISKKKKKSHRGEKMNVFFQSIVLTAHTEHFHLQVLSPKARVHIQGKNRCFLLCFCVSKHYSERRRWCICFGTIFSDGFGAVSEYLQQQKCVCSW